MRGHIALRRVNSKHCLACSRQERRQRYAADPERAREQARRSMAKWRGENPEVERERTRTWQSENLGKLRASKRRRRIAQQLRTLSSFGEFDAFVVEEAHALAELRGRDGPSWHVDHLVPLLARSASGLHCAFNLQVIPATLNKRKCNKMWLTVPGEWIAET